MSQKIANRTIGLVDYKELESNILPSIREGMTPLIKKLLEASLEGEIESHLSVKMKKITEEMERFYVQVQGHLTPRDRELNRK